jgi:hypothetical protein
MQSSAHQSPLPETVLTGAKRRIFILTWVQGLASAQGSMKPTEGFIKIKFF